MAVNDDQDPLEGLQERLQSHNRAFESLLALTPAQDYYGSHVVDGAEPSEQWNRKKQTKEQKRAAKKAKLDPANQKSALDIIKEREAEALKRKRDENEEDAAGDDEVTVNGKRQKSEDDADTAEARRREIAEKRKESRMRKKEKKNAKKARAEAKKAKKQNQSVESTNQKKPSSAVGDDEQEEEEEDDDEDNEGGEDGSNVIDEDVEQMDVSGLVDSTVSAFDANDDGNAASDSSAPTTPLVQSPAFDTATNHSATSSSSSIVPPSVAEPVQNPSKRSETRPTLDTNPSLKTSTDSSSKGKSAHSGTSSPKLQLPDIDHSILQQRLRQRIEELRVARKADGPDGKPVKSRQDLLDQRRKKEEQRKATKKEQIRKAKEEERRKQEERLRGSGSPLSGEMFGASSPQARENSFSFSRLAFEDGTSADAGLTGLQDVRRKKGPSDAKTALQAAQAKQSRIAGYDAEKQANIAEKDMWINASKRAHGERVRDDTSLLKKALKRKEKQKSKSEQQWKEREQAVIKGREMKQKKRETNLQKRKEEKGGKGKKKGAKPAPKKKGRPGFEGRFKA